eukprot:8551781-Prorocentrum_lima.AAC.1
MESDSGKLVEEKCVLRAPFPSCGSNPAFSYGNTHTVSSCTLGVQPLVLPLAAIKCLTCPSKH